MVEVIVRQEGKEEEGKVYVGKDHVPIQKALDYVNSKGGGKVFIEKGTYLINNISNKGVDSYGYKGIRVYSNTELCGEGVNTILKGDYSDTSNYPSTIAILNAENVKVHDIKITKGYCGIILYRSNNIFISDCNISKTTGYNGISLSSSSYNTIISNICNNNSSNGIYLISSSNNTITSNICNNNSDGIYLDNSSSNNTITSNTCNNNSSSGISLSSSSYNTIISNICNNNSSNGIYLSTFSSNNTITSNICNNNNSNGIYLYSSNNNTIASNVSPISNNGNDNKLFANFT